MHSSITSSRLRTALAALVALSVPSALGGCELATHFGDYTQRTPMDASMADGSFDASNRDANDAARDANVDVGPLPDTFTRDAPVRASFCADDRAFFALDPDDVRLLTNHRP